MGAPTKTAVDVYVSGEWNAVCYLCGCKKKASDLKKHWQGYYVCEKHWEPRHPQDFVRGIEDIQSPPWSQPRPEYIFIENPGPDEPFPT